MRENLFLYFKTAFIKYLVSSQVVMVAEKDSGLCFYTDYQNPNQVTNKNCYTLPHINDMLNKLSGSQWFSTLDLYSGYWQVGRLS